mgnify:FL=1
MSDDIVGVVQRPIKSTEFIEMSHGLLRFSIIHDDAYYAIGDKF